MTSLGFDYDIYENVVILIKCISEVTRNWEMSKNDIEPSRGLQRGFLVVANSIAALAVICTVWVHRLVCSELAKLSN